MLPKPYCKVLLLSFLTWLIIPLDISVIWKVITCLTYKKLLGEESVFLPLPPTSSNEVEYRFFFNSYLDEKCLHIGDFVLRRDMLLHCMLGSPDRHQDERVGEEDDGAGDYVAEE